MELFKESCKTCAGDLEPISASQYKCVCCGNVYTHDDVKKHVETLRSALDDMQLKAERNARRNLYKAVTAKYPSSKEVREWCREIKKYLPDDFQANFYEIANGDNAQLIAKTIRDISNEDIEKNAHDMETIIRFLISSMNQVYLADTQHLIERVYKRPKYTDLKKYEHYSTELSKEGENLDKGLYLTTRKRDVFIAYSSKDMALVLELMEFLEEKQKLTCFVALRNLKHGKGAKENYDKALQEAMSHCHSFVLVSSPNSRDFGCEALTKEIPYIQMLEKTGQKIHKVEYRVGRDTNTEADKDVRDFFGSQEWALSKEEVARRVRKAKTEEFLYASTEKNAGEPIGKVKYCIGCGAECPLTVNTCPHCKKREFADTKAEADARRENEKLRAEIEAQNLRASQAAAAATRANQNAGNTYNNSYNNNYNWQREAERREAAALQNSKINAEQMVAAQIREKARLEELIADTTEKSLKAVQPKPLKRWAKLSVAMAFLPLLVTLMVVATGALIAIPVVIIFAALYLLFTLKFLKVYHKPRLLILLNLVTYGLFTLILAGIAIYKCKNNKFPLYDQELRSLNDQLRNTEDRLNTARRSLDEINRTLGIY